MFFTLLCAAVLIPVALKVVEERREFFASSFGGGTEALDQPADFFGTSERFDVVGPRAVDAGSSRPTADRDSAALLRSILAGLLIAVGVSLLAALVTSERSMLAVTLALDDCLLVFVALLVVRRDARAGARVRPSLSVARAGRPLRDGDECAEAAAVELEPRLARRVYTSGAPVIAAPVVGALRGSVATTG